MASYNNFQKSFYAMISGLGTKIFLDPGNDGNAPADPPSPAGNYQFIQPEMFYPQVGLSALAYQPIPPAYVNWGQYPVNAGDDAGFLGGAPYDGAAVSNTQEADLYYDGTSNLYYDVE